MAIFLRTRRIVRQAKALFGLIAAVLIIGTIGLMASADMPVTGAFAATIEMLSKGTPEGLHLTGFAAGLETFLHFIGIIIIWFAVWTAFDLTVEGKFGEVFREVRALSQIKHLSGHFIVCGAGRVGKHIGTHLKKSGEQVVFIEKDKNVISKLRNGGFLVMDVGPIDRDALVEAGIAKAKGIAVSLGDDSKNLLLVLEARELNPDTKIAARVNDAKLVPKFKRAGANYIILPEAIGGIKLADALRGKVDDKHVFVG